MEVHFFLTREDLWHFLTYVFFRRQHWSFLLLLLIYVILTLFVGITSRSSFSLAALWPLLVLFIVPVLLVFRMRRITPEGIRERTDLGEGTRSWRTIKTITQDQYNLYFISDTMDSIAVSAVVIPRRALAAPQDAETFLDQARQHWMNGQEMLPGMTPGISPVSGEKTPPITSNDVPWPWKRCLKVEPGAPLRVKDYDRPQHGVHQEEGVTMFVWVKCHVFGHQLGELTYEKEASCKRVRRCKNCHSVNQSTEQHEAWTDWQYMEDDSCKQTRHCTRCGEEQARIYHQFVERTCARCLAEGFTFARIWPL